MSWLDAFIWTCALETPIYVLLLRRSFRDWWAPLVVSLFLQLLTHPLLWFLFPLDTDYWTTFFIAESLVSAVEGGAVALILWRLRERRALVRGLAIGLLANAFSATIGLLL